MNKTILASAISALLLSACSATSVAPLRKEVEQSAETAGAYVQKAKAGEKIEVAPKVASVERINGVYLPTRKLAAGAATKSPQDTVLARQITINRMFTSAQDLAERITALSGISVIVAPDVAAAITGGQATPSAQPAAPQGLPPVPLPGGMPAGAGQNPFMSSSGLSTSPGGFPVTLAYNGSLSGLLDVASARIGVSWELKDGKIRLFRYTSKTFRLLALPGDTNLDARIGNNTGTTSGATQAMSATSSSSTQNAGVTFSGLSVWRGIEDSIRAMLTPSAGKVTVTAATGTVTVTDTPIVVAQVEKFIEQQNAALGRQVIVNVRVLSVNLSDTDNYGINWDVVYNSLSKNFGMAFSSGVAPLTGAGNLALKVLNTAGASTGSSIQSWAGSKAVIEALSKQGRVSTVTSANVRTLNNQPAPIQVGKQTSYLASSTTSVTTGISTTSLTPGLVTTGFAMNLVPHILDGDKMLLQFAMDMSSLLTIDKVDSGTASIQTPQLETRNFLQRVMVNSGDTILVTGFENSEMNASTQGIGSATNTALGGAVAGKREKSVLVILIQPVLVE